MRTSTLSALVSGILLMGAATQAWALDAWRDRRGLYAGVSLGAGSGKTDYKGSDAHIGYNFRARVGGGVSRDLTLDAELGSHQESFTVAGQDAELSLYSGLLGASYFIHDGLYLRGMFGVAQTSSKGSDETGMGFGAGAGYEFFASGDLAVGVGGDYQLMTFDPFNITTINFGITATWY